MAEDSWPKIAQATLADRVYIAIRNRILEEQLLPGEFIREHEVSEALGVSRTPVREALPRLASEGFLERIPRRGFRLPTEPVKDLLELYPIVASLELLAGRLAIPNMDADDLRHLRSVNERMRATAEERDTRELVELNNEFHHHFSDRSGNGRLAELLADLRIQVMRLDMWYYSSPKHTEESISEHDEIIEAVDRENHERALELLERNFARARRALDEESEVDLLTSA